jgi:hypothetical protein
MENTEQNTQDKDYGSREQYIVIARVGTKYEGCRIIPEGDPYPAIYTQVFGPASKEECERWLRENCEEREGAGERQVYEVTDGKVEILESKPPQVSITAKGVVRTLGWTNGRLDPYVYVQPPPDGIWDFDFVATPPSDPAGDALAPIKSEPYTMPRPENFRGVRIHAETNKMEFFPIGQTDAPE